MHETAILKSAIRMRHSNLVIQQVSNKSLKLNQILLSNDIMSSSNSIVVFCHCHCTRGVFTIFDVET